MKITRQMEMLILKTGDVQDLDLWLENFFLLNLINK